MKTSIVLLIVLISFYRVIAQDIDKEKSATAFKIMEYIKRNDYDSIKLSFPDEIAQKISKDNLKAYVDMGAGFIKKYGIPKAENLTYRIYLIQTADGPLQMYSIIFPFPVMKEEEISKRVIEIKFAEKFGNKKMASMQVYELSKPIEIK